jgi:ABC-type Mn2+/Zn2+ transport system permease subunit
MIFSRASRGAFRALFEIVVGVGVLHGSVSRFVLCRRMALFFELDGRPTLHTQVI